jgi:lysophospholipid acyltransferase (LPLAT)-like uncharacterized protein
VSLRKKLGPALVAALGPLIVRALGATWRLREVADGVAGSALKHPVLYCFWHGELLIPLYAYRGTGVVCLVSGHRDGTMLRKVLERLGLETVVGSVTRGGAAALRMLLVSARRGRDLCIPPDGPQGPRGVAKKGITFIASRAQIPIVPTGVAASSAWQLPTWDRMMIPKPFSRVILFRGGAFMVPSDAGEEELARYTDRLERAIDEARAAAGRIVAPAG